MPSLDLYTKHDLIYNLFQKAKIIENDFTGILHSDTSNLMTQISPYSIQYNESIFPELGRGAASKRNLVLKTHQTTQMVLSYLTRVFPIVTIPRISPKQKSEAERDLQIVTSNLVASEAEISILKEILTQLQLASAHKETNLNNTITYLNEELAAEVD